MWTLMMIVWAGGVWQSASIPNLPQSECLRVAAALTQHHYVAAWCEETK